MVTLTGLGGKFGTLKEDDAYIIELLEYIVRRGKVRQEVWHDYEYATSPNAQVSNDSAQASAAAAAGKGGGKASAPPPAAKGGGKDSKAGAGSTQINANTINFPVTPDESHPDPNHGYCLFKISLS